MAKQLVLNLRAVAQAHGFESPDALARASNVNFNTVSRYWYKPTSSPSTPLLIQLARTMGISVEALFIEVELDAPNDGRRRSRG